MSEENVNPIPSAVELKFDGTVEVLANGEAAIRASDNGGFVATELDIVTPEVVLYVLEKGQMVNLLPSPEAATWVKERLKNSHTGIVSMSSMMFVYVSPEELEDLRKRGVASLDDVVLDVALVQPQGIVIDEGVSFVLDGNGLTESGGVGYVHTQGLTTALGDSNVIYSSSKEYGGDISLSNFTPTPQKNIPFLSFDPEDSNAESLIAGLLFQRNELNIGVSPEMKIISQAVRTDQDYAWSWQSNLACCAMDEGVEHAKANRIAAKFMRLLFNVDMNEDPRYTEIQGTAKSHGQTAE